MVDFQKAMSRPFSDLKKLSLAAVFNILPILNFFTQGYALECAASAMKKDYRLPEWTEAQKTRKKGEEIKDNFGRFFINGFKAFAIGLIYALPVIICIVVIFFAFLLKLFSGLNIDMMTSETAIRDLVMSNLGTLPVEKVLILLFFVVVYGIFIAYITPMAFMNFISKGKFSAGFQLKEILRKAFTSRYLVAWLAALGISILWTIGLAIIGLISSIPVIGGIIQLVANIYVTTILQITMMTIYGEVYKEIK